MWRIWLEGPIGAPIDVPIRLLFCYSFAWSNDAILMAIVMLIYGLLRSPGHEAVVSQGALPTSLLRKKKRIIKLQFQGYC